MLTPWILKTKPTSLMKLRIWPRYITRKVYVKFQLINKKVLLIAKRKSAGGRFSIWVLQSDMNLLFCSHWARWFSTVVWVISECLKSILTSSAACEISFNEVNKKMAMINISTFLRLLVRYMNMSAKQRKRKYDKKVGHIFE